MKFLFTFLKLFNTKGKKKKLLIKNLAIVHNQQFDSNTKVTLTITIQDNKNTDSFSIITSRMLADKNTRQLNYASKSLPLQHLVKILTTHFPHQTDEPSGALSITEQSQQVNASNNLIYKKEDAQRKTR